MCTSTDPLQSGFNFEKPSQNLQKMSIEILTNMLSCLLSLKWQSFLVNFTNSRILILENQNIVTKNSDMMSRDYFVQSIFS